MLEDGVNVSRKSMLIVVAAVVVLAALAVADRYWLGHLPLNTAAPLPSARVAPDFVLKDVTGRDVHLSDFRGQVVVLNFWATWCQPCRIEIPWFNDIHDRYHDKGVVMLGISMDEGGVKDVELFLKETSIHYPVLLGTEEVAEKYGGIFGIPTTIIIGRDGHIAVKHLGLTDKDEIENGIKRLL